MTYLAVVSAALVVLSATFVVLLLKMPGVNHSVVLA